VPVIALAVVLRVVDVVGRLDVFSDLLGPIIYNWECGQQVAFVGWRR